MTQSHPIAAPFLKELRENLKLSPKFIQVVLGPRQVGKSTGISQLLRDDHGKHLYVSGDETLVPSVHWIVEKWQEALSLSDKCLLIIDEIQKVPNWSSVIKRLWDGQAGKKNRIRLVLLGSSSLQIQTGLEESLTGRFQLIKARHWDFEKSLQLTKMDLPTYIKCGGYPGSYELLKRPSQWKSYIHDSIIETVIGKDILNFAKVRKPALFRQTFALLMCHPAQEISYTKLLGKLQDAGNTDLVKHYIELFESAFLLKSLTKYSKKTLVKRSSSPKVIPLAGALIDREIFASSEGFGRGVEAAVGSSLIGKDLKVSYWRDGNLEVDFVVEMGKELIAVEVKTGRLKSSKGMTEFLKHHKNAKPLFLTEGTLEAYFRDPLGYLKKMIL